MKEAIEMIVNWFRAYYADGFFLTLAVAACIYLFVCEKEIRKKLLYPLCLLIFCVLNPVLYFKIYHSIIYWRLFWLLPDAILIAYAVTSLLRKCRKTLIKVLLLLVFCSLIVIKGTNVYKYGVFTVWKNPQKVAGEVASVCDAMLSIEEEPRCILPASLFCEARQYSGNIQSMYGRNAHWYIVEVTQEQWDMYQAMESESPDFNYILESALQQDYHFVVTYDRNEIAEDILLNYHFYEVACVDGYRVYYVDAENRL